MILMKNLKYLINEYINFFNKKKLIMDYKQIVDILENQPYYVKNDNQTLILKKPVVVKTFDNNNVSLSILRVNEDRKVYTDTP